MAEDEAAGAIGGVPGDEPHARLMRSGGDQSLRHVDAVMADHHVVASLRDELPHGEESEAGRLEIALEHRFLRLATLELSPREEAERSRQGRLADG